MVVDNNATAITVIRGATPGSGDGRGEVGPLPRLRAFLQGEMALLILFATPTPTGGVPAQFRLPGGAGALGPRRRARHGGRAPHRLVRRVKVPRELRYQAAPGRIGLRELVLLCRCQVPA